MKNGIDTRMAKVRFWPKITPQIFSRYPSKKILTAELRNYKPIHILHRESRYASEKIRNFADLMVEKLQGNKALN